MDEQKLHDILGQDVEVPDMINRALEETYSRLTQRQRPAKKRRPSAKVMLIAAALVVGGALCMAAGVPTRVYNFLNGGSFTIYPESIGAIGAIGGGSMDIAGPNNAPLILEDGRLWFVNGEERTDVTDLIDENTPYIYEHTDPATNEKGYVILGGTVDNFGWAEYISLDGGSGMTGINFAQNYVILDGERFHDSELTDEQRERIRELTSIPPENRAEQPSPLEYETVYAPWLTAAMEQLGIEHY